MGGRSKNRSGISSLGLALVCVGTLAFRSLQPNVGDTSHERKDMVDQIAPSDARARGLVRACYRPRKAAGPQTGSSSFGTDPQNQRTLGTADRVGYKTLPGLDFVPGDLAREMSQPRPGLKTARATTGPANSGSSSPDRKNRSKTSNPPHRPEKLPSGPRPGRRGVSANLTGCRSNNGWTAPARLISPSPQTSISLSARSARLQSATRERIDYRRHSHSTPIYCPESGPSRSPGRPQRVWCGGDDSNRGRATGKAPLRFGRESTTGCSRSNQHPTLPHEAGPRALHIRHAQKTAQPLTPPTRVFAPASRRGVHVLQNRPQAENHLERLRREKNVILEVRDREL